MARKSKPRVSFKRTPRETVEAARARVLRVAVKRGSITHQQARMIGKWDQAWYQLQVLAKAGLLKHAGFNRWEPTPKGLRMADD